MAKGVVATMDTLGYLTEPMIKGDRLVAYWFANRVDQCIILRDINSFQYLTAKHQGDKSEEKLLEDIEINLRAFLLECFDQASVAVKALRKEEGDKMFTLAIAAEFWQDGKRYDLAKSVILSGETYKLVDNGRSGTYGR